MKPGNLLQGIRVIDLSQYVPGPFATRQLADLGAEVIKIEPPQGDPMRNFMHEDDTSLSPIYRHLNRGKRICKLDLKSEAGSDKLQQLLVDADILLESFRPGVLARLGFEREQLDRINPRLIHCALSGYGQQGPYALRAGHDINYCALSSQASVSGSREVPIMGYPPIADHSAALQASIAMLAALQARHHRQDSIYLDLSITESILAWQYLPLLGDASERAGSILNGGAACYNFYQCSDARFISLGAIEPRFWKNFCDSLQQPGWVSRQFDPMPQKTLINEVSSVITSQPQHYWCQLLDPVDCCFEALLPIDEMTRHAQFKSRQALIDGAPRYPAWIDHQAVAVPTEVEQIESSQTLEWISAKIR